MSFSHDSAVPTRGTDVPSLRFVVGKRRNSMTTVGLGNPYIKKATYGALYLRACCHTSAGAALFRKAVGFCSAAFDYMRVPSEMQIPSMRTATLLLLLMVMMMMIMTTMMMVVMMMMMEVQFKRLMGDDVLIVCLFVCVQACLFA